MKHKLEAEFQEKFSKYNSVKKLEGAFELKDSLGKSSVSYNVFESQQLPSLIAVEKDGFRWKLSDADMRLKPFDYISTPPIPGWVGIRFGRKAYFILIQKFCLHRQEATRESITESECASICELMVEL